MSEPVCILRKPQVLERLAISKSTLHTMILNKEFSRPVRVSARCVGWPETEVNQWLEKRCADSRAA